MLQQPKVVQEKELDLMWQPCRRRFLAVASVSCLLVGSFQASALSHYRKTMMGTAVIHGYVCLLDTCINMKCSVSCLLVGIAFKSVHSVTTGKTMMETD